MKIINASVEFMQPVDGKTILKHLEACGRVCSCASMKGGHRCFLKTALLITVYALAWLVTKIAPAV